MAQRLLGCTADDFTGAIVHLHSTHCVAVSCLPDIDPRDVLPPLTAYYVMRVGTLPLVPYYPPGDRALAQAVRGLAAKHPEQVADLYNR